MKHKRRRILPTLLAATSLALAVGVATLWPRTTRIEDGFTWRRGAVTYGLATSPDRFCLSRTVDDRGPADRWYELPPGFHSTLYNVDIPIPPPPTTVPTTTTMTQSDDGLRVISDVIASRRVTPMPLSWRLAGFGLRNEPTGMPGVAWTSLDVPIWAMLVACLIGPTIWTARRLRRGAGLCRACGYDLRASPERCPECGERSTPGAAA